MTNAFPPPQAYTKEIVSRAYAWLQAQAPDVKEKAKNTEILVAMFLRAKRGMENVIDVDAPVSSKTFRDDLKNLAQELNRFSAPPTPHTVPSVSVSPQTSFSPALHNPRYGETPPISKAEIKPPEVFHRPDLSPMETGEVKERVSAPPLDDCSLKMVGEVAARLNLSSNQEAIRMLIALGYEKIRPILPNTASP